MEEMIAMCGLRCDQCPALKATRNDDHELRRQTAEQWSKEFGAEIKPEDVNCDGCLNLEGRHINYCDVCKIRKCGIDRGVANCAQCDDYACEQLNDSFAMAPAAKANLEAIRKQV